MEDEFKEYLKWAASQGMSSFDVYKEAVNQGFNPQQLQDVQNYYGTLQGDAPAASRQGEEETMQDVINSEKDAWAAAFQSMGYDANAKPYQYQVTGQLLGMQPSSRTPGGNGGASIFGSSFEPIQDPTYGSTWNRGGFYVATGDPDKPYRPETTAERIERENKMLEFNNSRARGSAGFRRPTEEEVAGGKWGSPDKKDILQQQIIAEEYPEVSGSEILNPYQTIAADPSAYALYTTVDAFEEANQNPNKTVIDGPSAVKLFDESFQSKAYNINSSQGAQLVEHPNLRDQRVLFRRAMEQAGMDYYDWDQVVDAYEAYSGSTMSRNPTTYGVESGIPTWLIPWQAETYFERGKSEEEVAENKMTRAERKQAYVDRMASFGLNANDPGDLFDYQRRDQYRTDSERANPFYQIDERVEMFPTNREIKELKRQARGPYMVVDNEGPITEYKYYDTDGTPLTFAEFKTASTNHQIQRNKKNWTNYSDVELKYHLYNIYHSQPELKDYLLKEEGLDILDQDAVRARLRENPDIIRDATLAVYPNLTKEDIVRLEWEGHGDPEQAWKTRIPQGMTDKQFMAETVIRYPTLSKNINNAYDNAADFYEGRDAREMLNDGRGDYAITRAWNRQVALAARNDELAEPFPDWEEIATYNRVIEMNQERPGDFLYQNPNDRSFSGYVGDMGRTFFESSLTLALTTKEQPEKVLAGAAAGGGLGAVTGVGIPLFAAAGGIGTAYGVAEYGNTMMDVLAEKGVDINDPEAIRIALTENKSLADQAHQDAMFRSIITGTGGGISVLAGGAGAAGISGSTGTRQIASAAGKELLKQGTIGAGTETVASLSTGKLPSAYDLSLEFAAEAPGGTIGAVTQIATTPTPKGANEAAYVAFSRESPMFVGATTPLAYTVDNGQVIGINKDIKVKEQARKESKNPNVRRQLKEEITALREEKYGILLANQKALAGATPTQVLEMNQTVAEIQELAAGLETEENPEVIRVAQQQINELGAKLTEQMNAIREQQGATTPGTQTRTSDYLSVRNVTPEFIAEIAESDALPQDVRIRMEEDGPKAGMEYLVKRYNDARNGDAFPAFVEAVDAAREKHNVKLSKVRKGYDYQGRKQVSSAEQVGQEPGRVQDFEGSQEAPGPSGDVQESQEEVGQRAPGQMPAGVPAPRAELDIPDGNKESLALMLQRADPETSLTSRNLSNEDALRRIAQRGYVDLYDADDMAVLPELYKRMTPTERKAFDSMLRNSETFRRDLGAEVEIDQDTAVYDQNGKLLYADRTIKSDRLKETPHFYVAFTEEGYKKVGSAGSAGAISYTPQKSGPKKVQYKAVALKLLLGSENKSSYDSVFGSRGLKERQSPMGTGFHELAHNALLEFFNSPEGKADFNQFRRLIVQRMSDLNIADLNDFVKRYDNADIKAEEFMVELASRIANNTVQLQKASFGSYGLQLIGRILRKVGATNKSFANYGRFGRALDSLIANAEEEVLIQELVDVLEGTASVLRAGGTTRSVSIPTSLKGKRFQRAERGGVQFEGDEVVGGDVEEVNLAGIQDEPGMEYERRRPQGKLATFTRNVRTAWEALSDRVRSKLERWFNNPFSSLPKGMQVAVEAFESGNSPVLNRYRIYNRALSKVIKSMSEEELNRAMPLLDDYWFGETKRKRNAALKKLREGTAKEKKMAEYAEFIKTRVHAHFQRDLANNPAYSNLNPELREKIASQREFYGTRAYAYFLDRDMEMQARIKKMPEVYKQAVEDLAQGYMLREADSAYEAQSRLPKAWMEANGIDRNSPISRETYITYYTSPETEGYKARHAAATRRAVNYITKELPSRKAGPDFKVERSPTGVPTGKFAKREDLPESLRQLLGEVRDPYNRMALTITALAEISQKYQFADTVNEVALNNDIGMVILSPEAIKAFTNIDSSNFVEVRKDGTAIFKKTQGAAGKAAIAFEYPVNMATFIQFALEIKAIDEVPEALRGYVEEGAKNGTQEEQSAAATEILQDVASTIETNYTQITDSTSPLVGRYVLKEFKNALKMSAMYVASSNRGWGAAINVYYKVLLQLRRNAVLNNLATWRKNIMGGWYFLFSNGVFPVTLGPASSKVNTAVELKNRAKKLYTGEYDAFWSEVEERVAPYGLLGGSVNMALMGDIGQSYLKMYEGEDVGTAWSWVKKKTKSLNDMQSRQAYHYGAIDDYTKMVAYVAKRENFAKRMAFNPEGKSYSELTEAQKTEVDKVTVERIKQNFPTVSRIHPGLRSIILSNPIMGDFLSFRLEAFRSYTMIYVNAVRDIKEGMSNSTLSPSQRNAYLRDGIRSLAAVTAQQSLNTTAYIYIGQSLLRSELDDDDDFENADKDALVKLGTEARGVPFILPEWMRGSNLICTEMKADGTFTFYNMTSEDPYDEVVALVYGREGMSRAQSLSAVLGDALDFNMGVDLIYNLATGKNQYGQDIVKDDDLNWFKRYVWNSDNLEYDNTYGGYVFKQGTVPSNIRYVARNIEKKYIDGELEVGDLVVGAGNLFARSYQVNIAEQFHYNLKDVNMAVAYEKLDDQSKVNRIQTLDEIRQGYEFILATAEAMNTDAMWDNVTRVQRDLERKFREFPSEYYYITDFNNEDEVINKDIREKGWEISPDFDLPYMKYFE